MELYDNYGCWAIYIRWRHLKLGTRSEMAGGCADLLVCAGSVVVFFVKLPRDGGRLNYREGALSLSGGFYGVVTFGQT